VALTIEKLLKKYYLEEYYSILKEKNDRELEVWLRESHSHKFEDLSRKVEESVNN